MCLEIKISGQDVQVYTTKTHFLPFAEKFSDVGHLFNYFRKRLIFKYANGSLP